MRGNKAKKENDSDEKEKENGKEGRICSLGIVLTKRVGSPGMGGWSRRKTQRPE